MGIFDELKKSQTTSTVADKPIMERLQELGDRKGVNPPPADAPPGLQEQAPEESGTECPTCGKTFKHLGRHKCKETNPVSEIEQPVASAPMVFPAGFMLLVDAVVPSLPVFLFETWVAPLTCSVAKALDVPYWGLAEYGKGNQLLPASLDEHLTKMPFVGVMQASSTSPEYRACASVLKRHATMVIQGTRL